MKKYTREEAIGEMAENMRVERAGYGSWKIKSHLGGALAEDRLELTSLTHDEEDSTGLMDGERYNPLCGFGTLAELESAAEEDGMTVEEMQEATWQDSANGDNYEPSEERNRRLAERLYEDVYGDAEEVVVGEEEEGGEA